MFYPVLRIEIADYLLRFIAKQDIAIARHSWNVKSIAVNLAHNLDLSAEVSQELSTAALLHDIGKLIIPRRILHKPGKLTEAEFEIIKEHSPNGFHFLKAISQLEHIAEAVLYHHEKFDGSGYPEGRAGEDIPLISRILTIADVYEATTADRVYRKAMTREMALAILYDGRGTQFDPSMVDIFLKNIVDDD
ncbi:MAG: HD-GYP domain-containing protein [Negativicutes bacterium]|nr:HD-GYP domain-containing protein [Negativicutes bacterium]